MSEQRRKAGHRREELKDISLLGNKKTKYVYDYSPELLETFENKHAGRDYFVKFNCPEFTSLCNRGSRILRRSTSRIFRM